MIRTAAILVFALVRATPAGAQSVYTADMLRDLPAGGNLFALLESAQPEITTDRFNGGGLNAGAPERVSAFLASWSQTQYRVGDVAISSPIDGTPMLFPQLAWWNRIDIDPSQLSASSAATGLAVDLVPRVAGGRWSWSIEGSGSGGVLSQETPHKFAPAISSLGDATHYAAIASGYAMGDKLGLAIGGELIHASTFERNGERTGETRSFFVNSSYALSPASTVRMLSLVQAQARHVQASLERGKRWRFFGGYTGRTTAPAPSPAVRQADRLYDGPIPSLIESRVRAHRWVAGSRYAAAATSRHSIAAGLDVERTAATTAPIPVITVDERLAGVAARRWIFTSPAAESHRHAVTTAAFVDDRMALSPRISVQGSLRFESADARAAGAETGISWRTLLPAVHVEWNLGTPLKLELLTGVSRHADQIRLGWVDYGDPNAPTASVYPWDGGGGGGSPPSPIMRLGPGTGGNPSFSTIDSTLKRPVTDQFILRLAAKPWPSFRLRVTGLARRQSSTIAVVNTGVPFSSYTMFTVPDANADWVNPKDDQQLPVYERRLESFGQDRYLLTNPDIEDATMGAVVVSAEVVKPRVTFRIGGTASASVGSGGSRGFTAIENDQSMLDELFTNPNAQTNARGRLFNDRAYTIKTMAIVRLPACLTLGAIGRFQDGQPFSRLHVVPFLNQGPEAIQAFPRGRSRFSYRATLDVRLQQRFDVSMIRIDLIADAYNLLNGASEVEEYVLTDSRFRDITAVQPPRSFHLGARVTF